MCTLDTAIGALSAVDVVLLDALAFDAAAGEYRPRQFLGFGLGVRVSEHGASPPCVPGRMLFASP